MGRIKIIEIFHMYALIHIYACMYVYIHTHTHEPHATKHTHDPHAAHQHTQPSQSTIYVYMYIRMAYD